MTARESKTEAVTFVDGPLRGQQRTLPRGTEIVEVGRFWTYRWAGRIAGHTYFAKHPRSRPLRRRIARYVEVTGSHPATAHYLSHAA